MLETVHRASGEKRLRGGEPEFSFDMGWWGMESCSPCGILGDPSPRDSACLPAKTARSDTLRRWAEYHFSVLCVTGQSDDGACEGGEQSSISATLHLAVKKGAGRAALYIFATLRRAAKSAWACKVAFSPTLRLEPNEAGAGRVAFFRYSADLAAKTARRSARWGGRKSTIVCSFVSSGERRPGRAEYDF